MLIIQVGATTLAGVVFLANWFEIRVLISVARSAPYFSRSKAACFRNARANFKRSEKLSWPFDKIIQHFDCSS